MNTKPTIAFFGTPELCIPILDALDQAGYSPSVIITNPDRPIGRKHILTSPPVKLWAQKKNIPVLQPEKLGEDFKLELQKYTIDLAIVVAYGKIMPEWLIKLPKYQTLNIHYSLLPKYRGASPVESALLHGDNITGVCIQQMAYAMDEGPILVCHEIDILPDEVASELRDRLNGIGASLLVEILPPYLADELVAHEQAGEPSYCYKTEKEDGEIHRETMSDQELWNRYRAYHGWPGIFFFDTEGKRIKITKARFENGSFIIEKVIPEGKSETNWQQ